jgi:hypothetical protein
VKLQEIRAYFRQVLEHSVHRIDREGSRYICFAELSVTREHNVPYEFDLALSRCGGPNDLHQRSKVEVQLCWSMINLAAAGMPQVIGTQIRDVDFYLSQVLQLGPGTPLRSDSNLSNALDMVISWLAENERVVAIQNTCGFVIRLATAEEKVDALLNGERGVGLGDNWGNTGLVLELHTRLDHPLLVLAVVDANFFVVFEEGAVDQGAHLIGEVEERLAGVGSGRNATRDVDELHRHLGRCLG